MFAYQRTPDAEPPACFNGSLSGTKIMLLFETTRSYTHNLSVLTAISAPCASHLQNHIYNKVCWGCGQSRQEVYPLSGCLGTRHCRDRALRKSLQMVSSSGCPSMDSATTCHDVLWDWSLVWQGFGSRGVSGGL